MQNEPPHKLTHGALQLVQPGLALYGLASSVLQNVFSPGRDDDDKNDGFTLNGKSAFFSRKFVLLSAVKVEWMKNK